MARNVGFPPIAVIVDASKVRRMVTAFLSAFAATLIVGVLARFAAIIFTSERTARVAAFAIALGFALGRYSYSGPASVTVALALTACIGAVAAL